MTTQHSCTQDRFLGDVAMHAMHIDRNDGVNRHIRFRKPGCSAYWFDLVTVPGILMINGDMGTYVFSRVHDMFEFFATDQKYARVGELRINPCYWSEKLLAVDSTSRGRGDIYEFDYEGFKTRVLDHYQEFYEDQIECEREARLDCEGSEIPQHILDEWAAEAEVRADVLTQIEEELLNGELFSIDEAHRLLYNFSCDADPEFGFGDSCEWNLKCYCFHFIWCLYAIQYGIQRFNYEDAALAAERGSQNG